MNWFYESNGSQQGPVTEAELPTLVQAGTVTASTLLWKEGMPDWKPLSEVRPDLIARPNSPSLHPGLKDLNVQAMREGALPSLGADSLRYAGFWIRFAAKFIDGILMSFVQFFMQIIIGVVFAATTPANDPNGVNPVIIGTTILILILSIAIQAFYNGIMIGKYGATLGKMACGLKVVMPDGSKVSTARAFGRYFAEFLSSFTLLIGYIIAAFDEEKRSLHDRIASTRVIQTR